MATLAIIEYPNPILRQKAKKVKDPMNPKIQELILVMKETLNKKNGLGLAAPQIAESIQLCLVKDDRTSESPYILINPQIKFSSRDKSIMEEGCLSIPEKYFLIERSNKIKVRYLDETGKKCKIKAEGLLARAIQHETDHLKGILITDKINKNSPC
jgi:peptide deformylase